MAKKEFRIGNLVEYIEPSGAIDQDYVEEIYENSVHLCSGQDFPFADICGLTLTDALLKRFDFEYYEMGWYGKKFLFNPINHKEVKNSITVNLELKRTTVSSGEVVMEAIFVYVNHCEYAHQLQNLWHQITGEELELK